MREAVEDSRRQTGGGPVTLLAHSAGGWLARVYLLSFGTEGARFRPAKQTLSALHSEASPGGGSRIGLESESRQALCVHLRSRSDVYCSGSGQIPNKLPQGDWGQSFLGLSPGSIPRSRA